MILIVHVRSRAAIFITGKVAVLCLLVSSVGTRLLGRSVFGVDTWGGVSKLGRSTVRSRAQKDEEHGEHPAPSSFTYCQQFFMIC